MDIINSYEMNKYILYHSKRSRRSSWYPIGRKHVAFRSFSQ